MSDRLVDEVFVTSSTTETAYAATTATAGRTAYIQTQYGGACTSTASHGFAGGDLTILAGAGSDSYTNKARAGGTGGSIVIKAGAGGDTASASGGTNGTGGSVTLQCGDSPSTVGSAGTHGKLIIKGTGTLSALSATGTPVSDSSKWNGPSGITLKSAKPHKWGVVYFTDSSVTPFYIPMFRKA